MDCSILGSSVHGIFQARVLVWGAIASFPNKVTVPYPNKLCLNLLAYGAAHSTGLDSVTISGRPGQAVVYLAGASWMQQRRIPGAPIGHCSSLPFPASPVSAP